MEYFHSIVKTPKEATLWSLIYLYQNCKNIAIQGRFKYVAIVAQRTQLNIVERKQGLSGTAKSGSLKDKEGIARTVAELTSAILKELKSTTKDQIG